MFAFIGSTLLIFSILFFLISITVYILSLIYSFLSGSPYVPTKLKEINFILKEACLKKGKLFIELGCGNGLVVRSAVKNYKVKGLGVDVNPILIWQAKFLIKIQKVNGEIKFYRQNIFNTDLTDADYIYLFLLPPIIKKLIPKFENELKKKTLVISHGFKIQGWEKKLIKILPHSPFSTYFYQF